MWQFEVKHTWHHFREKMKWFIPKKRGQKELMIRRTKMQARVQGKVKLKDSICFKCVEIGSQEFGLQVLVLWTMIQFPWVCTIQFEMTTWCAIHLSKKKTRAPQCWNKILLTRDQLSPFKCPLSILTKKFNFVWGSMTCSMTTQGLAIQRL